jgi:xanthine/uracil/vitamin C permease (AzgA family)
MVSAAVLFISFLIFFSFLATLFVLHSLSFDVSSFFCFHLLSDLISRPEGVVHQPQTINTIGNLNSDRMILHIFNLFFLYVLTLNGLARALSDLGNLTKPSGAIPRGNFLFIVAGLTTMLSGYMSGPPILISPETGAGIKAGAKTGLSTLVCGLLFGIAAFFSPIFGAVPAAGTAPLLIMIGVMMFANCKRIDWTDYKNAVPAYCVLFFIPFTYSILRGVAFGYAIYIVISFYTGEYIENFQNFIAYYNYNPFAKKTHKPLSKQEKDGEHGSDDEGEDGGEGGKGGNDTSSQISESERQYEKQKKGFFTKTIVNINKMLDEQFEMDADSGGVVKFEQF